ncbi:unnamed protein product [Ophioblennius macclurei]
MSDSRIPAARATEFSDLWTDVSKLCPKPQEKKPDGQMPRPAGSPLFTDFQSPRQRGRSRNFGLPNAESPGDVEPSQDIVWDPTSPTQAKTGNRNTRVVAISDIVNRIAPEDVRPKGRDSRLLQWIADGAIPCTPEVPRQRLRKKSSRQRSVDDLMKLARRFDENMQQDTATSEQLNTVKNDMDERENTSEARLTQRPPSGHAKHRKRLSAAEQVEAELHALFDSSTQAVSGPLSEFSATPASSEEKEERNATVTSAKQQPPVLKPSEESNSAAQAAGSKGSCGSNANNCVDFDDDWENDDLLNDSFVIAMTQNPIEQHDTKAASHPHAKTNTTQSSSLCKPDASTDSVPQSSNKPSHSALQELCPKTKPVNRSTFKLQPNPYFQAKEVSQSSFTAAQPKKHTSHQTSTTTKTVSASRTNVIPKDHSAHTEAESAMDGSDSLWDDGDDDALLYQVCDNVERISNSQQQETISTNRQEKQGTATERGKLSTELLLIDTTRPACVAKRQPSCTFVRSNSLPGTSCKTANYQGWNIPMKGSSNKSCMSQSFPGSHTNLGTVSQCKDSSGSFQAGNANVDTNLVTPRAHQGSKRNVPDSAATCNKVFVTSQTKGKCTAAEIERKKQEALARRRQRMQKASQHKAAP